MSRLPLGDALSRDLEGQVREAQRQWHSPAVSAGIVRDGALLWSTHVGSARLDPDTAPTNDTQYLIGSITKTFTAVLVMALRDAGKLSLNDRLDTYLPKTRHGAIPIRSRLAHASGLQREPVGSRAAIRPVGNGTTWWTLEHRCRPWPIQRIHRGPHRRDHLLGHPGRDVPAADHG